MPNQTQKADDSGVNPVVAGLAGAVVGATAAVVAGAANLSK